MHRILFADRESNILTINNPLHRLAKDVVIIFDYIFFQNELIGKIIYLPPLQKGVRGDFTNGHELHQFDTRGSFPDRKTKFCKGCIKFTKPIFTKFSQLHQFECVALNQLINSGYPVFLKSIQHRFSQMVKST